MAKPPTPANRAAQELRGLMADQRKKGRELADLLNKSQSSASRRMRGETPLNLNELETVAPWLGVSISRLTGNEIPAEITAN